MIKLQIQIQQKKESDDCTVKLINPKDLSKSSESEKNIAYVVSNTITNALSELQNKN